MEDRKLGGQAAVGACAQLVTQNTQNNLFLLIWSMRVGTQPLGVQPRYQRCKLPDFWPSNPVLWFAKAEFNFEVSGVATEREMFMHTANALPYDALTLVADLVTQPPVVQPYQHLKDRLWLSNQLTAVQMAEKILEMPELLAAMMKVCPEEEVTSAFFQASFL